MKEILIVRGEYHQSGYVSFRRAAMYVQAMDGGVLQIDGLIDDGLIDKDEFKKQIDEWIRVFRKTKAPAGTSGPLIDPEREAEAVRREEGIPLIKPVVDDLLDISKRAGIAFKER